GGTGHVGLQAKRHPARLLERDRFPLPPAGADQPGRLRALLRRGGGALRRGCARSQPRGGAAREVPAPDGPRKHPAPDSGARPGEPLTVATEDVEGRMGRELSREATSTWLARVEAWVSPGALVAVLLWGAMVPFTKHALAEFPVMAFTALRA